ncbi:hypothetical protein [Alkalicoccus luteus]|uniref:Uncharacterized protein n=1 Tax=Alkalicoccus luteus TaxID=1237094 RepID=A0A969PYJ2_9BACI|nr:hypothetical protein [Alkalicoccus luteus]NJP37907.1 hypothetical protein [Alkalicoccus luteus]
MRPPSEVNYKKHVKKFDADVKTYTLSPEEIQQLYPPRVWSPDQEAEIAEYKRRHRSAVPKPKQKLREGNWEIPKVREA